MRSATRFILPISGAFLMAVAFGGAHADPAPPAGPPAAAQSGANHRGARRPSLQNPQDKVICRMEIPTGSRLGWSSGMHEESPTGTPRPRTPETQARLRVRRRASAARTLNIRVPGPKRRASLSAA